MMCSPMLRIVSSCALRNLTKRMLGTVSRQALAGQGRQAARIFVSKQRQGLVSPNGVSAHREPVEPVRLPRPRPRHDRAHQPQLERQPPADRVGRLAERARLQQPDPGAHDSISAGSPQPQSTRTSRMRTIFIELFAKPDPGIPEIDPPGAGPGSACTRGHQSGCVRLGASATRAGAVRRIECFQMGNDVGVARVSS
jgi:hypothetical protein